MDVGIKAKNMQTQDTVLDISKKSSYGVWNWDTTDGIGRKLECLKGVKKFTSPSTG